MHGLYIEACLKLKNPQDAVDHYHKYQSVISVSAEDDYDLGMVFLEHGLFDIAIDIFRRLVKTNTENLDYQKNLYKAEQGKAEKHGLNYFQANYPDAVSSYNMDCYEQAIEKFSAILAMNLADKVQSVVLARRGLAYFKLNLFDKAMSDLEKARNLGMRSVLVCHALVAIYLGKEKLPGACFILTEAIEIDKSCKTSYINRAFIYRKLDKLTEAEKDEETYQKLSMHPDEDERIVSLSRKIEIDQSYISGNYYDRGMLYLEAKHFVEAKQDLLGANQLNPKLQSDQQFQATLKTVSIECAKFYLTQARYQEAIAECKEILKQDKDNQDVRNIFLSATKMKYQSALKFNEKPMDINTKNELVEEKGNAPII